MLTEFIFEGKTVRFVGTLENPLWIAKDVCDVLDLENVKKACMSLDDDEQTSVSVMIDSVNKRGTPYKRKHPMIAVNESGLYGLIFQSIKPEAKRFKKWVTSVVLPEIRKTGSYNGKHQGYQYGNKVLPFETEIPQAYRGLGEGAINWEKTFPDEFYKEIYRIHKLPMLDPFYQHPRCFAKITTKLIYNQLFAIAPMQLRNDLVLLRCKHAELRASINKDTNGKALSKMLHQYLSDEAREQLKSCLRTMIIIMRMSSNPWHLEHNLCTYYGQLDLLSA
jgi:prophage antirepressor-like protein